LGIRTDVEEDLKIGPAFAILEIRSQLNSSLDHGDLDFLKICHVQIILSTESSQAAGSRHWQAVLTFAFAQGLLYE